ncbi:MAG TPA: glycine zipper 2TM domain-containing protein [Burkholderiales bacterium]|jgi:outer membrane lipoprotein SlyB|nr:glycine zipper 2TM domain-containing protein [Burkholderiales bacterium]
MEATNKARLHPLLTAAAISVTVFSAVGVGAITGLLPTSHSTTKEAAPLAVAPGLAEAPVAQSAPQAPAAEPAMPAAPAATPAPKPVKKHVAHKAAPKPLASAEPAYAPAAPEVLAANVPPPPPAPVEAQRPAIDPSLGIVQSVKEVTHEPKSNGVGPIVGGIAGAVLGNQVGHGMGKNIATVLGAAGGAYAGKEIEQKQRATKSWEITVRLDDGSYKTIESSTAPFWHGGERVRLVNGALQPA